MTTRNDDIPENNPLKDEDKNIFSKALTDAKNILTGKDDNATIDKVISAKTELEKALNENKTLLTEKIEDTTSIKEKMQELTKKANELDEKLDTFEVEASKNKELEENAVIDVNALREVSAQVKEVAKETVKDLVEPENSLPTT